MTKKDTFANISSSLGLHFISPEITEKNFPCENQPQKIDGVFSFRRSMATEEVLEHIKNRNFRPASVYEMICWAKNNWNRKNNIAALGSPAQLYDSLYFPVLLKLKDELMLSIKYSYSPWSNVWLFPVIKNERSAFDFGEESIPVT